MPRGLPDYYNPDTLVATRLANLNDLLTAVLRITPIDNRGRMFWIDTFGEGIGSWITYNFGDGALPVATVSVSMVAPVSMKLDPGTLSGNGYSEAGIGFLALANAKAGVELGLWYRSDAPQYRLLMYWYSGTSLYEGGLRIRCTNGYVDYLKSDASWVRLDNIATAPIDGNWLPVKLVLDFENYYYVRLILGNTEYDLSSIPLRTVAGATSGEFYIELRAEAYDDTPRLGYLGYSIVSVDEP